MSLGWGGRKDGAVSFQSRRGEVMSSKQKEISNLILSEKDAGGMLK